MHKRWEEQPWRIERAEDAKITFTIALHGKHAWELLLEDSCRYHSIGHGWATDDPRVWEEAIAPILREFFLEGRSRRERAAVVSSASVMERPTATQSAA